MIKNLYLTALLLLTLYSASFTKATVSLAGFALERKALSQLIQTTAQAGLLQAIDVPIPDSVEDVKFQTRDTVCTFNESDALIDMTFNEDNNLIAMNISQIACSCVGVYEMEQTIILTKTYIDTWMLNITSLSLALDVTLDTQLTNNNKYAPHITFEDTLVIIHQYEMLLNGPAMDMANLFAPEQVKKQQQEQLDITVNKAATSMIPKVIDDINKAMKSKFTVLELPHSGGFSIDMEVLQSPKLKDDRIVFYLDGTVYFKGDPLPIAQESLGKLELDFDIPSDMYVTTSKNLLEQLKFAFMTKMNSIDRIFLYIVDTKSFNVKTLHAYVENPTTDVVIERLDMYQMLFSFKNHKVGITGELHNTQTGQDYEYKAKCDFGNAKTQMALEFDQKLHTYVKTPKYVPQVNILRLQPDLDQTHCSIVLDSKSMPSDVSIDVPLADNRQVSIAMRVYMEDDVAIQAEYGINWHLQNIFAPYVTGFNNLVIDLGLNDAFHVNTDTSLAFYFTTNAYIRGVDAEEDSTV